MNNTNETLSGFLKTAAEKNALIFNFKEQFPLEGNKNTTPLFIDYPKLIRHPETRNLISTMIQKEILVINEADTIIGIEPVGSTIATLIANQTEKRLVTDVKMLKNVKAGKCIIVKDQIINGRNTIGIIDDLQNAGFECLGIFVIFNENMPITLERFLGTAAVKEGGDSIKIKKACPIYSILTPQKIYEVLRSTNDPFAKMIADQYKLIHNFGLPENEKVSENMKAQSS